MFYLATVTKWESRRDSKGRISPNDKTLGKQFILNTDRMVDIISTGASSCKFKFVENPNDSRIGCDYIEVLNSVDDIITGADIPYSTKFITLPVHRKNNANLVTQDIVVSVNDVAYASAYSADPSGASWVTYMKDGAKNEKVLVALSLAEIYALVEGVAAPEIISVTDGSLGGLLVTWEDKSSNEDGFELWVSEDGGAYSLLVDVAAGTTSYEDTTSTGTVMSYKVRSYQGTVYSPFSNVVSGSFSWTPQSSLEGETPALYLSGRSGNKLTAITGNDQDMLLPIYKNDIHYGAYYMDSNNVFDILTTDLTLAMWVRSENTTNPAALYRLGGKLTGTAIGMYGWNVWADGKFSFHHRTTVGGPIYTVTTVNAMDQAWHFIVARINTTAKVIQLYIDNVKNGNDITYSGDFQALTNIQFKIASTANANEFLAPFDFADTYVYRSYLSTSDMTTLYNRGYVSGALAHWSGVNSTGVTIYDFSGNNYHLTTANGDASVVGYDANGSRQSLDKGYALYSNILDGRVQIPNKDDGTELTYSASGWYKIKSVAGNLTQHNLADSYININHANFDRSNTTIWSASARGTLYMSANPDAWHISELQRFNLYYWANTNYEGKCFVKGYPNSFQPSQYLNEIFTYATNKSAASLVKIYKYTGDYEAELLVDGNFTDALGANIWKHNFGYFSDFGSGHARYTGTTGAETGCIRQYLKGAYILGRHYRLRYSITEVTEDYAHLWFSGNAGVQFQGNTWMDKVVGNYDTNELCDYNADEFFEIQAGIGGENSVGPFKITNVSLKIIE